MKVYKNKTAFILSFIITFLAAIASVGGLFMKNLYQDNTFVKMAWHTNDIITLFVVVPLLVFSVFLSQKGSNRWFLILLGLLSYVFYNFAFYLFGATFNVFFLIYAALMSISAFSLVLFLSQSNLENIASNFAKKTPVKWVSAYLFLIAFMLFMVEFNMIMPFLISGKIPETIRLTGNITSVVFALDFSIVMPVSIIAAFLLWKRSSWGFVMSIIMLVKGFTYGLVLSIGTASLAYSDAYGKWDPLMPLYVALAVCGLLGCWLLLKHYKEIQKGQLIE
jgi:hypothetical protein